ncbi:MAG: CARDB domain-containing protein [Ottowia sp.]|uniref:CARDB domain-containing protein n=1 Tax=Ottowia sp. TaxID=1898956 RepID=UPI0039E28C7A
MKNISSLMAARRARLVAALLSLAATTAMAAPITGIQGSQGGTLWNTAVGAEAAAATVSTELLAFTVGGTTYSTGVNDGLVTGTYTAANFQAFVVPPFTAGTSTLTAWGSAMTVPASYPALNWFLSDGTQGLELATAVFNSPAQNIDFPIAIPSTASLTLPAIVTTQVGDPGTTDTYYFVDSSGTQVGNAISVSYGSVARVGEITWQFRTATGGTSTQATGNRNLRLQSYTLGDFLTAAQVGSVVAFRQVLSGQSDLAFVAYNSDLLAVQAPDLAIDLTGLTTPALGVSYSGSFSCTNNGAAAATVGTTCTVSNLPAGLSVGACTISGGGAWVAGDAVPVGSTVTCAVTGTPTATGTTTVSGSTSGSSTTTAGGTTVTTDDSDPSNNTATLDLTVTAPDMQVTSVDLPAGTEGTPYSGSFVCTNQGDAAAANATCAATNLPAWASVTCDPTTPVASLAAGSAITCTVSGTPPTGSNGTTAVTVTAGTSTPESNTDNNTGSGNIVIAGVPDMAVTSVDLPAATVGTPYSGSFVCTNVGTAAATDATCTATGVPAWASVTCDPTTPVASLAAGSAITCTVTGTPATGDKGTSSVDITAGSSSSDADTTNNTGSGSIVVTGVPNVVIDLGGLPTTGTVNRPYSGTFTCTNDGTADADAAACTVTGLPTGVTVGACTISPDDAAWTSPGTIPEGQTVTCAVSGTPTETGTSDLTGTGGTSTATATVTVSAAVVAPIPTMAEWALALMASLLAVLGLAGTRRMRRAD